MEKSPFDLRKPYFALLPSPVGDFRNGLETPLNFSLNRVIIQRGSGVGLMELKTFTCPPCLGGIFQNYRLPPARYLARIWCFAIFTPFLELEAGDKNV